MQDQYIRIGKNRIRYWVLGERGTTVILLHGIGGYIELWRDNIVTLSKNHQVFVLDVVGFGQSDKPFASYSLSFLAEFVKDFMDALRIERASLIGCSMGGGVATQFAKIFPNRLEKLVLVSSIGFGRATFIFQLLLLPFVGEMLTRPSQVGIRLLFKQIVYEPSHITPDLLEKTYQMCVEPGAQRVFLNALRVNSKYFGFSFKDSNPILHELANIITPTLLMWGQQDRITPVNHVYIAKDNLPNSRIHIFDCCGHWPSLEHSEEFNIRVLEFLATEQRV